MRLLNKLSQNLQDIIVGGIIIAGILILSTVYLGSKSNVKNSDQISNQKIRPSQLTSEHLREADYHLKMAEINRNIQQLHAQVENSRVLLDPSHEEFDYLNNEVTRFGLSQGFEAGARGVEKELERERRAEKRKLRTADKIEMIIAQDQFQRDYESKYEKAFVNHFIENMEKSGYEVQINDNLQVVRVKKIQNP